MIKVRIETADDVFIVENCTCYFHAIEMLQQKLGKLPHIQRISNLDDYGEELEVISFEKR